MWTPTGPSMQMAWFLAEIATDLTVHSLMWIWRHCDPSLRLDMRLARLEHKGAIAITDGSDPLARIVRVTDAGRLAALGGRDPQASWSRPWDGRWRMVVFDVPESRQSLRRRMRRQLHALRFGYLQDSVWISPDPPAEIRQLIAAEAVDAASLTLLEAQPCGGESHQDLVAGAWDFDQLNRRYAEHRMLLNRASASMADPTTRIAARHAWLRREWNSWHAIARRDPFLPETLLPPGYLGRQVWTERRRLLTAIAQGILAAAPSTS